MISPRLEERRVKESEEKSARFLEGMTTSFILIRFFSHLPHVYARPHCVRLPEARLAV